MHFANSGIEEKGTASRDLGPFLSQVLWPRERLEAARQIVCHGEYPVPVQQAFLAADEEAGALEES